MEKLFVILFTVILCGITEYFCNYLFVKHNINLFYDMNKKLIDKELKKYKVNEND